MGQWWAVHAVSSRMWWHAPTVLLFGEVKAGRLGVKGHLWICSQLEFQPGLHETESRNINIVLLLLTNKNRTKADNR